MKRVYVVITEPKVIVFGNLDLAEKFVRRAKRLPSLRDTKIELINCEIFKGKRRFDLKRNKERQTELQMVLNGQDFIDTFQMKLEATGVIARS
jgi:hypothetical protein